jgi:TolA-binding protein
LTPWRVHPKIELRQVKVMTDKKKTDITLQVLVSIRDEIKGLREDTNKRFEQMDKRFQQMDRRFEQMDGRFERIEADLAQIRQDIGHIVTRFDRDFLLMATDVDSLKRRLKVCEEHLGIRN